jgi:2-polyprenyl-3-methyl-5-hydroxy-6-metoxy-1,4-benzoquinol methylase
MLKSAAAIHEQTTLDHFSERASEWNGLYALPRFADRLRLFVQAVVERVQPGGQILDYGCGTGTLARALAEKGFMVTAVDGAEGMIRQARKDHQLPNLSFELIESAAWRPGQSAYDGIVCSSVIEYIPDEKDVIRRFGSALRPGGLAAISVPNGLSMVNHGRNMISRLLPLRSDSQYAQRLYYPDGLASLFAEANLEIIGKRYFEFPLFGEIGVSLSRVGALGSMALVIAKKRADRR